MKFDSIRIVNSSEPKMEGYEVLNLEHYQAIIFDMDGTLLDTMPSHLDAWRLTTEHYGLPFDQRWIHSMGGMPSVKIAAVVLKHAGSDVSPQTVANFKLKTFQSNACKR